MSRWRLIEGPGTMVQYIISVLSQVKDQPVVNVVYVECRVEQELFYCYINISVCWSLLDAVLGKSELHFK